SGPDASHRTTSYCQSVGCRSSPARCIHRMHPSRRTAHGPPQSSEPVGCAVPVSDRTHHSAGRRCTLPDTLHQTACPAAQQPDGSAPRRIPPLFCAHRAVLRARSACPVGRSLPSDGQTSAHLRRPSAPRCHICSGFPWLHAIGWRVSGAVPEYLASSSYLPMNFLFKSSILRRSVAMFRTCGDWSASDAKEGTCSSLACRSEDSSSHGGVSSILR